LSSLVYASAIKVASYNVQNLFDTSLDGTEYNKYIPNTHNWNDKTLDLKLNHVSEVICDIDAQIIGLQEIENQSILEKLVKHLERVGCGYYHHAISQKKGSSIQVALLSRYPIEYQRDIIVNPRVKKVRNILEVAVEIEGNPLLIFVNHWKSKAYNGYESKRIPYAKALQNRLLEVDKEYILLGDFNANYNTYLRLEPKLNDTQGYTAFNDVLQTKIGDKLVDRFSIRNASKGVHYSLWNELALEERYSGNFYGVSSTLDHIVLGASMFDGKGIDYVDNSFSVYKAKYLFTKEGYINRWKYKNKRHQGKGYSDHLPLYASFDMKPYFSDKKKIIANKEIQNIEYFYNKSSLNHLVVLKDVFVLFKRGNHAVIKQSPKGRAIILYACAKGLKEGYEYDLLVEGLKNYHGLKEITHAYVLKAKSAITIEAYYANAKDLFENKLLQNEVLRDIVGEYKDNHLYVNGNKIPIHFRNKKHKPKNGKKIKIDYAHLGYYKQLQLVIYRKKDFQILEK
jgi:endonuclease/exonuclease/phosphatase family metal-dependent hydrolase